MRCLMLIFGLIFVATAHEAKDFDDSVLYKIDFEIPDLLGQPELNNQLRSFYTLDKEKYECLIPTLETPKEEEKSNQPELSPIGILQPIFSGPTCSYRIEAYWSYEICHGHHVRQYHEEREGKNVKFQEYYLGKWSEEKTELAKKEWEAERKAGGGKPKYKTLKIDNTRYPYFEMEFNDGTMCDIIEAPRTTMVRYVCYPHGKDDIYSFKETSSCNYEAIILTSSLCSIPAFHAEETKEISIKCFNSPTETHKPLSMLRQELKEWTDSESDLLISKENKMPSKLWTKSDVENIILEMMANDEIDSQTAYQQLVLSRNTQGTTPAPLNDMTPLIEFISGKNCLTGGTGWWKYEFCYGRHVRQFHKDKNSEVELFLGYYSEELHRAWYATQPEKGARQAVSSSLWHHYSKGTHCDQTGLPREVNVKLTCTPVTSSGTAVSMYLMEPKTCHYILVVESPIICGLMQYADENDLVSLEHLQKILTVDKSTTPPTTARTAESEEQIRS
ncbi:LOW QUALITY PROTEIN: endoplasmic reticulum lectin 1 [Drosophila nasuta]|uniref:LOW QUALITY PROTEIN: endoplasmic reticulum lectin 1 n=1 Tax=Drosophila nasuta TaxID=42062 RepID=UPI00295EDA32|nr:LOW QUALITY PROTEIN: endoplasmic reticulum lectin 1 [Drosophila nasuta]